MGVSDYGQEVVVVCCQVACFAEAEWGCFVTKDVTHVSPVGTTEASCLHGDQKVDDVVLNVVCLVL